MSTEEAVSRTHLRSPQASLLEGRARSLRRLATQMDVVSAEAFRRRASELELLAFGHRCRLSPASPAAFVETRANAPINAPADPEPRKVHQVA